MESKSVKYDVSVIIPVHGNAPHLITTIESIKKQSLKEYEVIVILDRASEEIEIYARKLALDLENFRVINSEKPGISHALNTGIRESCAEFIARIDADDLMRTDRLALQKNFLEKYQDVVCVGSQITKINDNGVQIGRSSYPASNKRIVTSLLFRNCIAHPSVMYRRSSILEVHGYRPEFDGVEDYDLWLRLSVVGKIRNIQKNLTLYRVWDSQVTNKEKHRVFENAKRVRESFEHSSLHWEQVARCKGIDWHESAEFFNKSLQNFRNPGEKILGIRNLFMSFKITPSLTTRVCAGYIQSFILSRIWSF